jgi:hypothetical protein
MSELLVLVLGHWDEMQKIHHSSLLLFQVTMDLILLNDTY